jgi:hypothetical protein
MDETFQSPPVESHVVESLHRSFHCDRELVRPGQISTRLRICLALSLSHTPSYNSCPLTSILTSRSVHLVLSLLTTLATATHHLYYHSPIEQRP